MAAETGDRIRNVALVGRSDAGKTILTEAMLHAAGETTRVGSVDDGTTVSDHEPEEKERKHSISSSILHLDWKKHLVNVIDTPGALDFAGEAIAALRAVDLALLVVSPPAGVGLATREFWKEVQAAGLPCAVVLNRLDMDKADFESLLDAVRESLGAPVHPLVLPAGAGSGFQGVVSVFDPPADLPESERDRVGKAHAQLLEAAIEGDDALLERYLEGGEIAPNELRKAFVEAFVAGRIVPVLATSGEKEIGIGELLDMIVEIGPPAVPRRVPLAGEDEDPRLFEGAADAPFVGFVFKCVTDPYVGKLSFFRVLEGTLQADSSIRNLRADATERIGHLYRVQGKEQTSIPHAGPGEIAAIAKVESLEISDTIAAQPAAPRILPISFPAPMVPVAVHPKTRADEQKISSTILKISSEDPTFQVKRESDTHELVVRGLSNVHLETQLARLKRRFEVEVTTSLPKVPFRETLLGKTESHYRHKKQTGGRGQFGDVYLRLESLERGSGFEFADEIVGGSVPAQYRPAVEKGIREVLERGVLAGFPFQDVRTTLYDGGYHPVDSSEAAFKIAGARAFQQGVEDPKAKAVILEPIMDVEVTCPSANMGDISGDMNSRRGRIVGMDTAPGGQQIIRAQVPLAEMLTYSSQLRSMTAGEGTFKMELSHYDPVPAKMQQDLIAKAKAAKEQEN